MSHKLTYQYSVARYLHDPSTGEALNIGIVLYCAAAVYLKARLNGRFKRLSDAFAGFNGDQYRSTINRIERAFDRWAERLGPTFSSSTKPPVT